MMAATAGQYSTGRETNPSEAPNQVKGSVIPTTQIASDVAIRAGLARLSTNGILAVRMIWMISV